MIARALRLRQPFEFERVRKQGRSWTTPLLVLAVLANDHGHNRYGFAVGRRVGGAVERNRVKRRLREAVRELHPTLEPGFDVVLIARGPLADESVPYERIAGDVESLFRRARLLAAQAPAAGSGTPP
jgi:ribonuclease P protein component